MYFPWNFAKSRTQMFSLWRLWYLITECIRNALVWKERCCPVSRNTVVSTSRPVAFFTSRFAAASSPFASWQTNRLCFKLNCRPAVTVQLDTALARKLTGSSENTIVTSVPQMHLLNAEIDTSTKAKTLCCMFLSCHYIVWYCKIIVCPNLHYKMFFPTSRHKYSNFV